MSTEVSLATDPTASAIGLGFDSQVFAGRRSPVLAANGTVATSQPLAAQAGVRVLQDGGSAIDAAIATAAALTLLEPTSNGLGSDAFVILWDGSKLVGINGSGRWPAALDASRLRDEGHRAFPERGWYSVTVPGCVRMWRDLHERYGKLPFARLMAPAREYAEQGFLVSPVIGELWRRSQQTFSAVDDPALAGWFETFAPAGAVPGPGQRFASPAMARAFARLAEAGPDDFYEGAIAEAIVDFAGRTGGFLGADDLANHRSEWVEPIGMRYGDLDVWEIPPNGQGIAALIALGILDGTDIHGAHIMDERAWHLEIEAMKAAFSDNYRYVADPDHASVPTRGLLEDDYIRSRRALLGDRAGTFTPGEPDHGTVYLSTADRDGMMVSFIQSNYMGFGSGIVEPGMGISMQNRGAGFALDEDHPNVARGGKRPRHTIIPGFLTRAGKPIGPFGVMGGEMQPQGHLQFVRSIVDGHLNPQAALDKPRWRIERDGSVHVEPGMPADLARALEARGHRVVHDGDSLGFGRGQAILRLPDGGYVAASEPRTDGAAVGY